MVGGIKAAVPINLNLARAAQSLGLAMVVGSQRCLIEKAELAATFQVRDVAPDILLFANLGAVQFNYGFGVTECLQIIQVINADALVLHLNPLQEVLQWAGNTDFSNLLRKIGIVCRELKVPVIVKEVGSGISEEVARSLACAGVSGIDVAGAGGTCWSEIEKRRTKNKLAAKVAGAFAGWGIPTAKSIILTRRGAPHLPIIASGGIRSGIDVAKAIALGADAAGIATPLLEEAMNSSEEVEQSLKEIIEVLRIAMFCTGAADIQKLQYSSNLKKL
jgi:isopentenyl-diphosphate delta-isomerase